MGFLRWPGAWRVLPAAGVALALIPLAHAVCTGPQALTAKLRDQPTTENAIALGKWFAGNEQFECAAETFRAALRADPDSAQLHFLEALALAEAKQPAAAVPELQEAIRLQPDAIKPHLLLADLYKDSGQSEEADIEWRKALAIDPLSEIALQEFSDALLARKDYLGVIHLLEHAPRDENLALTLAQALEGFNYFNEASDELEEARKSYPDSLALANEEAMVLIKMLAPLDAVKLGKDTLDRHLGDSEAELIYLRILVMTEHHDDARPLRVKLLAEAPHDPEVLYLNGIEDREDGDLASSKAHLEEAVALVPGFDFSRYHLGMTLVALHEWPGAKENLQKAIALGFTGPKAHYELGLALHALGENEKAAEEIQKYQDGRKAEQGNQAASRDTAHGDLNAKAGNLKDAIADYRSATETAPDNAAYFYKLSVALHKAGDTDGERAALEQSVKLNPGLASAQRELGYLLSRSGDSAGSIEHFRLAVKASPSWTEAWINLAAALGESGQFAEARTAAATALRLDPANAQAKQLSDQLARDPAAQQANP